MRLYKACLGEDVLFTLDGLDEYRPGLEEESVVKNLICEPGSLDLPLTL